MLNVLLKFEGRSGSGQRAAGGFSSGSRWPSEGVVGLLAEERSKQEEEPEAAAREVPERRQSWPRIGRLLQPEVGSIVECWKEEGRTSRM